MINGSKCFITSGSTAGVIIITARTEKGKGSRGISNLVVPAGTPGLKVGLRYHKLGLRASDTTELFLDDCRVPADHLLGEAG